ncbi:MAG: sigma-70 family RNA polymerase sigma factor [Myxococcales bacterium]|nr:sigma-70 family RNA polymerase sigma factor [Myxococcales bacterium]MCB9668385.1 sigma-70 family RNA polymerase sigma factor [Alphaproteobacteria bacterium]MCB9690623.1 sigma-70 family RNA polymerase sigma factor [Alphaproteobacteria bacterium]
MSGPESSGLTAEDREGFREQLARVTANRHSPEAAALYKVLFDYSSQRVHRIAHRSRLSTTEQEEVVGDVLLMLMKGSLASFRGGSLPELLGFVRTITDRACWRVVRRRQKEREALEEADIDDMRAWTAAPPEPADAMDLEVESPLEEKDQEYLLQLLRAGTKAELARQTGVSRAAVTQRVRRILTRVESLDTGQRYAHEVWLERQARVAVALDD